MEKARPFSKLKKRIESLFDPALNMEFKCLAYPMRSQRGSTTIPRFYVTLHKEIIWDFPKDFDIKQVSVHAWKDDNDISNLVRDYIDTPIDQLLQKEFILDNKEFAITQPDLGQEVVSIKYNLADLFKAADRRLGKQRLSKWSKEIKNPAVYKIMQSRFNQQ